MTLDLATAKKMVEQAQDLLAKAQEELARAEETELLPKEPAKEGRPAFVTFYKTWGDSWTAKNYVAIRPNSRDGWFMTRRTSTDPGVGTPVGMSWGELMDFLVKGEGNGAYRTTVINSFRVLS